MLTLDISLPSLDSDSAKITIDRLTECLIRYPVILCSIASDQGTSFTAHKVWQWALCSWDSLVLPYSSIL